MRNNGICLNNKKNKIKVNLFSKILSYVVMTLFAVIFLVPFAYAISIAFTAPDGKYSMYVEGFKWYSHKITWYNFKVLFREYSVIRGFINTICYIIPPVFVGVFSSALAAYSFARISFKGRDVVFMILLSTMVIPGVITLIPSYLLFAKFYRWTGTPLPLIIPGMFGAVGTMFFIKQFYQTLPKSLEDAAKIDGMNWFGIFMRIAIPLGKPVLITQIILSLAGCYNDYMGPLLYVGTIDKYKTLQLIIATINSTQYKRPTIVMAGATVSLIPTFIMFLFAQRYFVDGFVMSGIKG